MFENDQGRQAINKKQKVKLNSSVCPYCGTIIENGVITGLAYGLDHYRRLGYQVELCEKCIEKHVDGTGSTGELAF